MRKLPIINQRILLKMKIKKTLTITQRIHPIKRKLPSRRSPQEKKKLPKTKNLLIIKQPIKEKQTIKQQTTKPVIKKQLTKKQLTKKQLTNKKQQQTAIQQKKILLPMK